MHVVTEQKHRAGALFETPVIDAGSARDRQSGLLRVAHTMALNSRLVASLLAIVITGVMLGTRAAADAQERADVQRRGNVLALRKTAAAAPDHQPVVERFARLAAASDPEALFRSIDGVSVRANGELAIRHYLNTEVMPFFADFARLDPQMRVTSAAFEDGSEGLMAYAYAVTTAGKLKPFVIAWRDEPGALHVMDVQTGQCVRSRHPAVAGGCNR